MSEFEAFFYLGFSHIVALDGIDHILFIAVLAAVYRSHEWRKVLVLVTAFTIGHSITLSLAALGIIGFNKLLIELLIPLTILATAILNFYERPSLGVNRPQLYGRYAMAVLFGLIHGFAFSNLLKEMYMGMEEGLVWRLFSFNVGLEVGQILVVVLFMVFADLLIRFVKFIDQNRWKYALSGLSGVIAIAVFAFKLVSGVF